jgi:hypothetical protein
MRYGCYFITNVLLDNIVTVTMLHVVTMHDTLATLKDYCAALGAEAEFWPEEATRQRLPLFLAQLYDPFGARMFGREMHLLVAKRKGHATPAELEAHAKVVMKLVGPEIAFVFDQLPSFDRNRLLKRRVAFIVPHRQMFLPGGVIDLREAHGSPARDEQPVTLSMPAQLLLLYHLQKRGGNAPFALFEWATALKYSRMSITRAHRDLLNAALVEPTGGGKRVVIQFAAERRELWERALPLLRSPVQKQEHYRLAPLKVGLLEAGLTALARYTDMAAGLQQTLAAWRTTVHDFADKAECVPYRDTGTVLVQRWWYPPAVLTEDNQTVDRLSLFLSLRQDADERIQAALADLLEGVKW